MTCIVANKMQISKSGGDQKGKEISEFNLKTEDSIDTSSSPKGVADTDIFQESDTSSIAFSDYLDHPGFVGCGCFSFGDFFYTDKESNFINLLFRKEKHASEERQGASSSEDPVVETREDSNGCTDSSHMDDSLIVQGDYGGYDEVDDFGQGDGINLTLIYSFGEGDGIRPHEKHEISDSSSDSSSVSFDSNEFEEQEFEADFGMSQTNSFMNTTIGSSSGCKLQTISEDEEASFSCMSD